MRQQIFAITLLVSNVVGDAMATEKLALTLKQGEVTTVAMNENPSTGYRWSIDSSESRSLDILRIEDKGAEQIPGTQGRLGAPQRHGWMIQAVSPGNAVIAFVYRRPWEHEPAQRQVYTVRVLKR